MAKVEEIAEQVRESIQEKFPDAIVEVVDARLENPKGERVEAETAETFLQYLAEMIAPKPHPIIKAVHDEFSAFADDYESNDFGERAQEIVGTKSMSIPEGLMEILDTFLPLDTRQFLKEPYKSDPNFSTKDPLPEGVSEDDVIDDEKIDGAERIINERFRTALVCFIAGIQYGRKNGAAPVTDTVAV